MENKILTLSPSVHQAFTDFIADDALLALPLALVDGTLQNLPPVSAKEPTISFQITLNKLETVINPWTSLYLLIMRRKGSPIAITFVPYLTKETEREFFLAHRLELVQQLGEANFSQSLICKEVGEITDARSWHERDGRNGNSTLSVSTVELGQQERTCDNKDCKDIHVEDLGYRRNRCRLCDRRMKNRITPEALVALTMLSSPGAVVQICVNSIETLTLTSTPSLLTPTSLASHLPTTSPSFTFFHHPTTHILYFIFHSPDSATVRQRMKHTLAIPGLIVHAEDVGVHVDQKIEIHDPEDLVFEAKDEKIGRFRSMYLRNGFRGTELMYERAERDGEFYDGVK